MLFNSVQFFIFFPVVILAYYLIPKKVQNIWLLLASYVYYLWWDVRYIGFLLGATVVSYFVALCLGEAKRKKAALALGIVLNIGMLLVLKYTNFFIDTLNGLLTAAHRVPVEFRASFLLPVGISFYSLQIAGYLTDIYRGKIRPEKNFLRFALFTSFFPQILSGPIARGGDLLPQLGEPRRFDFDNVRSGLLRMLWGFFIKLVITERLCVFADAIFNDVAHNSGVTLIVGALVYGIQIYCDFLSYSHLALGAAEVLGIRLMENFKTPYFSDSASEFWRRWHISLSSWLRDYIYIPLGGNRKGTLRKYLNIMIVFLVSGLWHGASWTFVIWGGLNGLYQVLGAVLKKLRMRIAKLLRIDTESFGNRLFKKLFTFLLIDFSWIFFRAADVKTAFLYVKKMFTVYNPWVLFDESLLKLGLTQADFRVVFIGLLALLGVSIANYHDVEVRSVLAKQSLAFRWCIYLIGIFAVLIFGKYGPAYAASNFIYSQF